MNTNHLINLNIHTYMHTYVWYVRMPFINCVTSTNMVSYKNTIHPIQCPFSSLLLQDLILVNGTIYQLSVLIFCISSTLNAWQKKPQEGRKGHLESEFKGTVPHGGKFWQEYSEAPHL